MDKGRGHIITDLNDDRLWPDEVKEDGEALDFSLTLTQASSLFIICQAAIPTLKAQLVTAKKRLTDTVNYEDNENLTDLNDTVFVLQEVLQDANTIKKEVTELINELG